MVDIQKMVDEGEQIYVVNKSARILGKSHLLVLEFPNPSGGRGSTVKIPPIKYPINLTRQVAPPSAIPMSRSFVNWVNRGVLEVMSEANARAILSDPEAKNAIRAAYNKLDSQQRQSAGIRDTPNFKVRNGGARETRAYADLEESGLTQADFYGQSPEDAHRPIVETVSPSELRTGGEHEAVSARIQKFCADLQDDPSLKKDFLTTLKSWDEDEFTGAELGYLLDNLGAFENISSYIRSLMADRAGKKSATPSKRGKKVVASGKDAAPQIIPTETNVDEWLEE